MGIALKDTNASAYQYQLSVQNKLNNICEPLFSLGVKYFIHLKIFQSGKYSIFANHKDYIKACLECTDAEGEIFAQYINATKKNEAHTLLLPCNPHIFDKKKDPIIHIAYNFNIWNMFSIYKGNGGNFIKIYVFAGERNDLLLHNLYINNYGLLERFCNYFDEKAEDIVDYNDESKLPSLGRQFSFYNNSQENFLIQDIKIQQFLQETFLKKRNLQIGEKKLFSSREEIEGLWRLTLGRNIKDLSSDLDIPLVIIEKMIKNYKDVRLDRETKKRAPDIEFLHNSLSVRQKECFFFLVRGYTAKQIAQQLGLSYRTVETHINHLKNKFNCRTKGQLIEMVFEKKL